MHVNPKSIKLTAPRVEQQVVQTQVGLPAGYQCSSRYIYAHFPTNWEYDDEYGFLPRLSLVVAKPGVNGVGTDGKLHRALAMLAQRGATVIDPKDPRLGEYTDSVRFYETDSGAKHYCDFCDEATVLPNGTVLWNTNDAKDAFLHFRAAIRDSGIIEGLHQEVFVSLKQREDRRADSLHGRAERNPHLLKRAQHAELRLETMDEAWQEYVQSLAVQVNATPTKAKIALNLED